MITYTQEQFEAMDKFVEDYIGAENAATGSIVDSNANVTNKNVITLLGEMQKPFNIQYNRYLRHKELTKIFGKELADKYIADITSHRAYQHDESQIFINYCVSVTLFPFLHHGSKSIGGITNPPKHLTSFVGGLINLMNQIAASFSGAIAIPSLLICFDYFARRDYGDDYLTTHKNEIEQELQHLIYYLNEPCSGRAGQSIFWNLSILDEHYMKGLYSEFIYPEDNSRVDFVSVARLQEYFMTWFNKEREKELLTFPVVTAAMVYDGETKEIKDIPFKKMLIKELSEGNSFFIYLSDSVDSLSSCCRLRNEIEDNTFSFTLGNVGEMTGSINVITINMNRLIQDTYNKYEKDFSMDKLRDAVKSMTRDIHKYHVGIRSISQKMLDAGMYPIYDAHFIEMDRQYSTIGVNGVIEGAEFLGYEVSANEEYLQFCSDLMRWISEENKLARKEYGIMFNTEFVPGENAGHKLAQWDKRDGYVVPRDIYNSYMYPVEADNLNLVDKAIMHGERVTKYLDGGSAKHDNLESYMSAEQYEKWIDLHAQVGVNYFCSNILITCCEDCGHINKNTLSYCNKCNSKNISHATRIIGFLKKIKHWSAARQKEGADRYKHDTDEILENVDGTTGSAK